MSFRYILPSPRESLARDPAQRKISKRFVPRYLLMYTAEYNFVNNRQI